MMQSKNILPLLPTFDFDSLSTKVNIKPNKHNLNVKIRIHFYIVKQ